MSEKKVVLAAIVAALCLSVAASGQYSQPRQEQPKSKSPLQKAENAIMSKLPWGNEAKQQAWTPSLQKASDLMSFRITDAKGEELATIRDFVLDKNDTGIEYVVASVKQTPTMEAGLVAIPCAALKPKSEAREFVLRADRKELESAPRFQESNWPDTASETWARETFQRFGQLAAYEHHRSEETRMTGETSAMAPREQSREQSRLEGGRTIARPSEQSRTERDRTMPQLSEQSRMESGRTMAQTSERTGTHQLCRLSQATDKPVKSSQGQQVGKIQEIMVDMTESRPVYAFVALEPTQAARKIAVVPWNALQAQPDMRSVEVEADASTLESVAYAQNEMPNLSDQAVAANIHDAFNREPYWTVFGYVSGESRATSSLQTFNPDTIETVTGTIEKVYFTPGQIAEKFVQLRLNAQGKTVRVRVGPQSFLHERNCMLKAGDTITVTGSKIGEAEKTRIVAQKIEKSGTTVELRDARGAPMWRTNRSETSQMEPMKKER